MRLSGQIMSIFADRLKARYRNRECLNDDEDTQAKRTCSKTAAFCVSTCCLRLRLFWRTGHLAELDCRNCQRDRCRHYRNPRSADQAARRRCNRKRSKMPSSRRERMALRNRRRQRPRQENWALLIKVPSIRQRSIWPLCSEVLPEG